MVSPLVLLLSLAYSNEELLSNGFVHKHTKFGGSVYSKKHDDSNYQHEIYQPAPEAFYNTFLDRLQSTKTPELLKNTATLNCEWGDGPNYFRFAPQFKAAALPDGEAVTFKNHCFEENTAQIIKYTNTTLTLRITASSKSSWLCNDHYFLSTLNIHHLDTVFLGGSHEYTFNNITPLDMDDIRREGVRVFTFCDDLEDLVIDVGMTLKLFLGGFTTHPDWPVIGSHTTPWMVESNLDFLRASIGYDMKKRSLYKTNITESDIHSGDFLAITRLDGLDEIIMYGSGSRVGHSTMAIWLDNELYVMESQAGWYWPRNGIQINKFSQWIEWAENASFNIALLPLKQEYRDIFNTTAVYEWFKTVEGMPYGFHNFLFGWIDTPSDNFPPLLDPELFEVAFRIAEQIAPSVIEKFFTLAMNKHLGTEGLNIPELSEAAAQKGMTFNEVMAVVEQDDWIYPDGYSMVCSSFVLACYLRAGILGDLTMQATEFTPRDVYSLNIFDTEAELPQACKDADPDLPYCMVIGDYQIILGSDYGSIAPYNNMNEHCPSIAPDFVRPANC